MQDRIVSKINFNNGINDVKGPTVTGQINFNKTDNTDEIPDFKNVMTSMIKNLDSTVKAPDQVMQNAMIGNGADVHDVMIAISKAEIGINLATQVTTKVVQAYEKVMSIQV